MTRWNDCFRVIGCLLLVVLQASCGGGSESAPSGSSTTPTVPPVTPTPLTVNEQLDQYLATYQGDNGPGISILMVKDGVASYRANKGMANVLTGAKISGATGFRLASVSKMFTAIGVMQLVEKSQLKLSDSILNYFPEFPEAWRSITVEHLLMHQSGLYDLVNEDWNPTVLSGITNEGVLRYLAQHPALKFQPGTDAQYNNLGFVLLTKIIERQTGLKFPDYMARFVFQPAGMTNSYIVDENQEIKAGDAINHADRYTYYGLKVFMTGSMAQVSSTDDFLSFFSALRHGSLVSFATLADMTRKHSDIRRYGFNYGYGFIVSDQGFGHSGQWDGFETEMFVDPGSHREWVILTNSGTVGRIHIEAIKRIIH